MKTKKYLLFFIIIFAFLDNKASAQTIKELETQLENVLKEMHVPGMSIAIVHKEGPEWVAGLGKADVNKERPATAATLFRIGSVSKGFVSLAILTLVEEGKLSLDDSVQKLAPEVWFDNKWEKTDPIRVVHLLENTTGWDDMHLSEFAKNPLTLSSLDRLDFGRSSRVSRWCPGTRMSYCNSGPAVAAYIVEKIAGKSFEEYVEQCLFKHLGMHTATYLQPPAELTTTLYHSDGKTPLPYWNLLYRSIGSINANATDMANYLLFYLNRGHAHGTQIVPTTLFNRMEFPTSTWAAKEGLRLGYGLNNYSTIYDGFVYHGHDGNMPGGLTAIAYMPHGGSAYFYSLNSGNREAFKQIGQIIRTYITSTLQKPPIPPVISLSKTANLYGGWYLLDSPRTELFSFLERLSGMRYIHFKDNTLLMSSLSEKNAIFLPVTDDQFRYVPLNEFPDTEATLKLLKNDIGKFIQLNNGLRSASLNVTLKHIPTWLAMYEISIVGFILLTFLSILIFTPFWVFKGLSQKNYRSKTEYNMLLWPLVSVLSVLSLVGLCMLTNRDVVIWRMGNLTMWSFSLFLTTLIFATASVASVISLLYGLRTPSIRSGIRLYSIVTTVALVIAALHLAYWGVIGLRTWA